MPEPEVIVNNKTLNGSTQIVLNLKSIIVIISLIISIGGTIFGVVSNKLNKLDDKIIKLSEEDIKTIEDKLNTVNAQNTFIMKFYNIDVEFEAEQSAEARRNEGERPRSLVSN